MLQTMMVVSGHRGHCVITIMFLEVVQGRRPRCRHVSRSVSPTLSVPALTGFLQTLSSAGFMVSGRLATS